MTLPSRRFSLMLMSALALWAGPTSADTVETSTAPSGWDVTQPRGRTRTIDFETDEGTWMSVDVSPDARFLVFDLMGHIYRVSVDGGDAQCLTQDSGVALNYHPRISPDGRTIAFISDRAGQDNLWLMDGDGRNPRPLLLDLASRFAEPAWLPDGSAVVLTRRERTKLGLYRTDDRLWVVRLNGTAQRLVNERESGEAIGEFTGAPRYNWPAASPDGRYVYFGYSRFDGTDRQLRRIDRASGQVDAVTASKSGFNTCCSRPPHTGIGETAPELSPDGRWLAFLRKVPGGTVTYGKRPYEPRTALWLRDLESGEERILADPMTLDAMAQHPQWYARVAPGYTWAPDSRSIFFSEGGKLRRVILDTNRIETIPFRARILRTISEMSRRSARLIDERFAPHLIRWPTSSPHGKSLVYEAAGALWFEDLRSGRVERIPAPNGTTPMTPSWSPAGDWIAFVTFDGTRGDVYKWRPGLTDPVKLTSAPAAFYAPEWSVDGKQIYLNRWPPALDWSPDSPRWELVGVPAAGGDVTVLSKAGVGSRLTVGAEGRLYFAEPRGTRQLAIVSLDPKSFDRREHSLIQSSAKQASVSPDGKWIAIEQRQDIYVARMPASSPGQPPPTIDTPSDVQGTRRVSRDGGYFVRWRDAQTLEFASAGEYRTFNVHTGQADAAAVRLRLPRDMPAADQRLALTGGRILTMANRKVIERGDIVVDGGRIVCVGTCDITHVDRTIDVTGKTVMPGLFDVHAHAHRGDARGFIPPRRPDSALYLAHGVTTIFDPSTGDRKWAVTVGDMVETGALVGPRTYNTTEAFKCNDDDDLRPITTLADAREHVQRKARMGVPSLKDFVMCTRAERQMLVRAAAESNLTVTAEAGELFYNLGLVMDGHAGWEHWIQMVPLYGDVTRFLGLANAHYSPNLFLSDFPHGSALEYYLSETDAWQIKKLRTWYPWQYVVARRSFVKKPLQQYIMPLVSKGAADIKRAGGYVAVGAHGEVHGVGTHWEIWSLALEMSPIEALESATLDSAHFIGLDQDLGSVEAGKIADLIVLDSNPLEDIRNTLTLRYVIKDGAAYEADTLDRIWPTSRPYGRRSDEVLTSMFPKSLALQSALE